MKNINNIRSSANYTSKTDNKFNYLSNHDQESYDGESITINDSFFDAESEFFYDAEDKKLNDSVSSSQNSYGQKSDTNNVEKSHTNTEGTPSDKYQDSNSVSMSEDLQRVIHSMIDKIGELGGAQLISRICNYMLPELPLNQLNLIINSYRAISKGEDIDMALLHGSGTLITALDLGDHIRDALGSLSSGYIDANFFGNVGDTAKQYIEAICYIFLMVSLFAKKTPAPERAIFRIPLVMTDVLKKAYQTISILYSYLPYQNTTSPPAQFQVDSQIKTKFFGKNGSEYLIDFQASLTFQPTNHTVPISTPLNPADSNSTFSLSDEVNKRLVNGLAQQQFRNTPLQCTTTKRSSFTIEKWGNTTTLIKNHFTYQNKCNQIVLHGKTQMKYSMNTEGKLFISLLQLPLLKNVFLGSNQPSVQLASNDEAPPVNLIEQALVANVVGANHLANTKLLQQLYSESLQPITAALGRQEVAIPPAQFYNTLPFVPKMTSLKLLKPNILEIYGFDSNAKAPANFRLYNLARPITVDAELEKVQPFLAVTKLHCESNFKLIKQLSAVNTYIRQYKNSPEQTQVINNFKAIYSLVFGTIKQEEIDGLIMHLDDFLGKMHDFMSLAQSENWNCVYISFKDIDRVEKIIQGTKNYPKPTFLYRSTIPTEELRNIPSAVSYPSCYERSIIVAGEFIPTLDSDGNYVHLAPRPHPEEYGLTIMHEMTHLALGTVDSFTAPFKNSDSDNSMRFFKQRLWELKTAAIQHLTQVTAGQAQGELPLLMGSEDLETLTRFLRLPEYKPEVNESLTSLVAKHDNVAISLLLRDAEIAAQAMYQLHQMLSDSISSVTELKELYPQYFD